MTRLVAYHNDPAIKSAILAQLAAHRAADELVKGQYWEGGKGCAVGCTLHSGDHTEYESRFGIPVMLAQLEDVIFENLDNGASKEWPERFMGAIEPGADLSLVGWELLHWLLTDADVNPGIAHSEVRDAVRECADLMAALKNGGTVTESAARAAESAAWSAARAARAAESAAAARAAWAAWSAAWSAAWAARAARAASWAAWSAESAAESAAWSAAESAAWSAAESAASVARSAAWKKIADKLVELIERK